MNIGYKPLLYLLYRLNVIGKYKSTSSAAGLYYSELNTMPVKYQDHYNITIIYSGRDKSV